LRPERADSSMPKKVKLIVSDFHLGRGRKFANGGMNVLEDFHYDNRFEEFLEYYTHGDYEDAEVELIFNGDMLNLIQVDYHGHYPVIITENVSTAKMKGILDGHTVFFRALRNFLNSPKRTMTYVVGNHDQEMLWKGTREAFERAVGKEIQWKNTHYQIDGIHIEHGHQYEAVNRMDPTRPFLTENLPEPILNLPWGTLFTIQYITRLKMQRPFVDKVRPFRHMIWWSLFHDTWMAVCSCVKLVSYFISTRFSKNRYRQSSLKTTLRIFLEASVFPDLSDSARRILRTPDIHTVVFGHTHVYKHVQFGEKKQYLNLGTWTEITSLDLESYARKSRLTYVRVDYDEEGNSLPLLRHWIGKIPLEDDAMGL
jgi:UDP-2,3-diacylglucosamine pyrophosphatase LpxH